MRNAIAVRPWPTMNSRPNMVENQCGSMESTQSMAMKVTLKPQKMRPGQDKDPLFRCAAPRPSRSSAADQRLKNQDRKSQPARYSAARPRKNGTFRYTCLCWRTSSAATALACDHWYRLGMPIRIGANIKATSGRVRAAASHGRRMTTPHAPPVRYWSISQVREPTLSPTTNRDDQIG